jgi:hypothetical protein
MKIINIFLTGIIVLLLTSCKEEKEKPKVIYGNTSKPKTEVPAVDTTILEIADLPVEITGTNYLIHPVGDVRFDQKAKYGSSGGNDVSYTISNYNEFEITGFLHNLKFQRADSDSLTVLTDKPVLIQTATFLKSVADKTRQQFLVYTLADMDTNKDDKLDASDIKSLYISTISGDKFTKLSTDFEELIDWKIIESKNRLYFRTIEDTNKNGEFDKDDVLHYNYLDLLGKEWQVVNYKPI